MSWKLNLLFFCFTLQLLAACVNCRRPVFRAPRDAPTTGKYIVVLKHDSSKQDLQEIIIKSLKVADDAMVYGYMEKTVKAFTVKLSSYSLETVRHMPHVDYIEEEGIVEGYQDEYLDWHLDRLDQLKLPLDYFYRPIGDGAGVDVYILDSGISYHHEEFEYRAKYGGYDPVDAYEEISPNFVRRRGQDCHGHGTHVASLCGGKTYGSAKKVTLYSIRVLRCDNTAPWSTVMDGLDYCGTVIPERGRPAIVSLSLGGNYLRVVNDQIRSLHQQGIHVVTAAGNGKNDACFKSPASSNYAITVGGTSITDGLYLKGSGTNYGLCVDIFAPGETVQAADYSCNNCSVHFSGTSMSTPIVSGIAAIHLSRQPLLTPDQLKQKLIDESIKNVINFTGIPPNSWTDTPNRLITMPGSCGGNDYVQSEAILTSPNYPRYYPNDLQCVWTITADSGQYVRLNLTYVNLETNYDVLMLYDGYYCNDSKLMQTITGHLGPVNIVHHSSERVLTLVLQTDSSTGAPGFNATYTKLYEGTELKVPEPDIPFPTLSPRATADILYFAEYPARRARDLVNDLMEDGYHPAWLSAYSHPQYLDMIFHNSTEFETRGCVDQTPTKARAKIEQMREEGFSVWYLTNRRRSINWPHYSIVFGRTPDIIETEVYLQDDMDTYFKRLEEKKSQGYRLRAHCFVDLLKNGVLEASSVFTRDRRIPFNINVGNALNWTSYHNLTFFEFTAVALQHGRENLYPSFLDVWKKGDESRFAAIFEELQSQDSKWFRWGMNATVARQLVTLRRDNWDPVISVGYTYLGNVLHFLQFQRKRLY